MFSATSGCDQVQPSRHLLGQSPQTTSDGTAVAATIAANDDATDATAVDATEAAADATVVAAHTRDRPGILFYIHFASKCLFALLQAAAVLRQRIISINYFYKWLNRVNN